MDEEIPPICWAEGIITGVLRNPPSFDPARTELSQITINLSQDADNLTVRILNSLSQEVKVLYSGSASTGAFHTTWNGTNSNNEQARYSIYLIDAVAKDAGGQVIGSGQCDLILYKPKAGISAQNADKFRDPNTHEWLKSTDEFVGAGLVNPGDVVSVTFDSQDVSLANNEANGIFRSQVLPYSPGYHTLNFQITPAGTMNPYNITWTVWLTQIEALGTTVLRDGIPVQPPRNYFIPAEGEEVRLDFSLDASEPDVRFYAVYDPPDDTTEGTIVRTVNLGSLGAGNHNYTWDGRNDQGFLAQRGQYSLVVIAPTDPASDVFVPASIFASRTIEVR